MYRAELLSADWKPAAQLNASFGTDSGQFNWQTPVTALERNFNLILKWDKHSSSVTDFYQIQPTDRKFFAWEN